MKNYRLINIFDYLDIEGFPIDYEGGKYVYKREKSLEILIANQQMKIINKKSENITVVGHDTFLRLFLDIEGKYNYHFFC